MTYDDPILARLLLESAIAADKKPVLTEDQIVALMQMASSEEDGVEVYTSGGLNKAAATGWRWKAAAVQNQYELGAGPGQNLKRQQQFEQAMRMAALYSSGEWTVDDLSPGAEDGDEDSLPVFIVGDFLTEPGNEWS